MGDANFITVGLDTPASCISSAFCGLVFFNWDQRGMVQS